MAEYVSSTIAHIRNELSKVIVGQEDAIEQILIAVLAEGHALVEGVPGTAKTLTVKTLARIINATFSRIQFTPDLMPSDITGTNVFNIATSNFNLRRGPIFTDILLADEINRTPPKTQAALLESMQEYSVTIAGARYDLPRPFFVLATQNPIEQEGTYPLPEAQLDRFMFNILLTYPSFKDEVDVVKATTSDETSTVNKILTGAEIAAYQHLVRRVPVPDNVIEYAVGLANKTRPGVNGGSSLASDYLEWGAGPRASQYLVLGAKCNALLNGKYSPDIEDVQAIAKPVLRHRIVRNFKAEAEGISVDDLIEKLMG
jgi:MoxR-like ATPases